MHKTNSRGLSMRNINIASACRDHNYKWPKVLTTGVMFYNGYRITIDEFNEWARKFK